MRRTEQDILEELFESIYSGNVDSDKDDKKTDDDGEKDSDDKDEKDDSNPFAKKDDDDKDDDSDGEDTDSDDSDDGDDEDDDSDKKDSDDKSNPFGGSKDSKGSGEGNGPFTSKIRTLQKQYNDLLVDAFEKYAPECIEDALGETETTFGENIEDILNDALDRLKTKILDDLGVEAQGDMMPPEAMGGFDPMAGAGKPMEIELQ